MKSKLLPSGSMGLCIMNKRLNTKTGLILTALLWLPLLFICLNYQPALIHLGACITVYFTFRYSIVMAAQVLKYSHLKDPVFIPHIVYRHLTIMFLICYALSGALQHVQAGGFIALACGFIFIASLKELHYRELLQRGYLPFLYLIRLLGGIGYLWLGIGQIHNRAGTMPLYVITFGYLFSAIMFITMFILRNREKDN